MKATMIPIVISVLGRVTKRLVLGTRTKTCHLMDFAVSDDHRKKMRESESIETFIDLLLRSYFLFPHSSLPSEPFLSLLSI